jgi:hypothetical protein
VLIYTLLQPWQRLLDPSDPRTAQGIPILLVHGLVCNG